jgi:hypothetical protein
MYDSKKNSNLEFGPDPLPASGSGSLFWFWGWSWFEDEAVEAAGDGISKKHVVSWGPPPPRFPFPVKSDENPTESHEKKLWQNNFNKIQHESLSILKPDYPFRAPGVFSLATNKTFVKRCIRRIILQI